jgi:hypothetical protein
MCRCGHEKTAHGILPGCEMLLGKERALVQGAGRCLQCACVRWSFWCWLDKGGRPTDNVRDAEVLRVL